MHVGLCEAAVTGWGGREDGHGVPSRGPACPGAISDNRGTRPAAAQHRGGGAGLLGGKGSPGQHPPGSRLSPTLALPRPRLDGRSGHGVRHEGQAGGMSVT